MATVAEFNVTPEQQGNIRMRQMLQKKSGAFPYSWRQRYFVLGGNMLFEYANERENRPKKAICVDKMTIQDNSDSADHPHAVKLTSVAQVSLLIAFPSAEDMVRWKAAIKQASYERMFSRAQYALKFLNHCSSLLTKEDAAAADAASGAADGGGGEEGAGRSMMNGQAMIDAITAMKEANLKLSQSEKALQKALDEARQGEGAAALGAAAGDPAMAAALEAARKEAAQAKAALARQQGQTAAARSSLAAAEEQVKHLNAELSRATESAAVMASAMLNSGTGDEELDALRRQLSAATTAHRLAEERSSKLSSDLSAQRVRVAELEEALAGAQRDAALARAASIGQASASGSATGQGGDGAQESKAEGEAKAAGGTAGDAYEHEWLPFYKQAQNLERAGRFTEAETHYQHVMDVRRHRSGEHSIAASAAARDLGRILALQQNYGRAEQYYAAAVDLCAELQGESHPNTACALTDLAAVQREQGKLGDAERHARRAVESLRVGVGGSDVSTATALYNLAGLCRRQGKYDAAADAYGEALTIFKDKLGDCQGETADTLYQLGCLHRKRREYLAASRFFGDAANAYSNTYGPADRRVAEATHRQRAMTEKVISGQGE